jgi:quinol monooxygenase YgiN
MIHVIAEIQIADGKVADFLAEFHAVVPAVLAEDGCIEYGPNIDVDAGLPRQVAHRPSVVTVVEKWESLEHLNAHLVAPHMLEYREKVKDFVIGAELRILEPA